MPIARWMLQTKRADFDKIAKQYGITPVSARIMRNREVIGDKAIERYLHGKIADLESPHRLKDMDKAVEILTGKVREKKAIRIIGDYDIDGVCSTYLLFRALERVGAIIDYDIPDRIKDGYGVSDAMILEAKQVGIDTVLTCDNGIAAIEQLALAKSLGMTVIITDHHEVHMEAGEELLPPADAIVNPRQKECAYPYKSICGGLVAYRLVQALYEKFCIPTSEWEDLLEFAAIATVGDVMPLQEENRIIVKSGLKKMAQTKNLGLKKLMEKNNLIPEAISAYHIGFVLGPCLNAGGRLETAKVALELLLCEEEDRADKLALELKALNDLRKKMTLEQTEKALAMVETSAKADKVLVVYLEECHESLAGIIAGRLREHYQKPSFVLSKGQEGVKGSGRSIPSYSMFEELTKVSDLLLKFGGHPMAAGFSLSENKVDEFRCRLNQNANLTDEDFVQKIWIDVAMPISYINESMISELERLEPFGQGNEKPQFAQKGLQIRTAKVMGQKRNVVKLRLSAVDETAIDAVLFEDGDEFLKALGDRNMLDVVYYPTINEYNGNRTVQIVIKHYKFG